MDKRSRVIFTVFFFAVIAAAGISFYRYYVLKDFFILAEKSCDPKEEVCFVRGCYTASDDGCTEGGEFPVYCKLIKKNASTIQDCDPKDPSCGALDCEKNKGCEEIPCNEETRGENYGSCSDPETYLQEDIEQ